MTKVEIYCLKCKATTGTIGAERVIMKNGRPALSGTCEVCQGKKSKILKREEQ